MALFFFYDQSMLQCASSLYILSCGNRIIMLAPSIATSAKHLSVRQSVPQQQQRSCSDALRRRGQHTFRTYCSRADTFAVSVALSIFKVMIKSKTHKSTTQGITATNCKYECRPCFQFHCYLISPARLTAALAGKVMRSVVSVRPSVCFTLYFEPSNLQS